MRDFCTSKTNIVLIVVDIRVFCFLMRSNARGLYQGGAAPLDLERLALLKRRAKVIKRKGEDVVGCAPGS